MGNLKIGSLTFTVILLMVDLLAVPLWGAEGSRMRAEPGVRADPAKKEPILITSDRMVMDQKKNMLTYQGNVVAIRGDVTLKSDSLTATFNPKSKRIDKVIAKGKLVVTQGNRVATGAKAVFSGQTNTVTITGKPKLRQGNSEVSGARIILFINEDRGIVEGGKERVKAVIFPEELGSKGFITER